MRLLIGIILIAAVGCSGGGPAEPVEFDNSPLTLEAWKALDRLEKYDFENLERVREGDPKLKSEKNWGIFMQRVVVPERKKDFPESTPGN
ncbi:MAG: hypothetical protein AAF939_19885 [Planctomycetota bacterium]